MKKIFYIGIILLTSIPIFAGAQSYTEVSQTQNNGSTVFPADAITKIDYALASTSPKIILNATTTSRTILYAKVTGYEPLYNVRLYCGADTYANRISTSFGNTSSEGDFLTYKCNSDIVFQNTGIIHNAWAKIVYVDRDLTNSIVTTSTYKSLDIFITFFLEFLIIAITIVGLVWIFKKK